MGAFGGLEAYICRMVATIVVDFPVPGGPWTRTIWVDWGLVVQIRDVVRATRLCSVFSPMIMGTPEVKIGESYCTFSRFNPESPEKTFFLPQNKNLSHHIELKATIIVAKLRLKDKRKIVPPKPKVKKKC